MNVNSDSMNPILIEYLEYFTLSNSLENNFDTCKFIIIMNYLKIPKILEGILLIYWPNNFFLLIKANTFKLIAL